MHLKGNIDTWRQAMFIYSDSVLYEHDTSPSIRSTADSYPAREAIDVSGTRNYASVRSLSAQYFAGDPQKRTFLLKVIDDAVSNTLSSLVCPKFAHHHYILLARAPLSRKSLASQ